MRSIAVPGRKPAVANACGRPSMPAPRIVLAKLETLLAKEAPVSGAEPMLAADDVGGGAPSASRAVLPSPWLMMTVALASRAVPRGIARASPGDTHERPDRRDRTHARTSGFGTSVRCVSLGYR